MSVADIISAQQDFATESIASADALLSKISNLADTGVVVDPVVAEIPSPGYGFDTTDQTVALLTGLFPTALSVADISATAPSFTPTEIDELGDITVPEFTKSAPELDIPSAPSSALPTVPTSPSISDPVLPSSPVVTLPTAPAIGTITLPEPPSIEIPAFTLSSPVDDLVAPTNSFEFFEQLYTSALLDALQAKLLSDLENGGYGIELSDEAALWDRARSRELEGAMAEMETILVEGASRGFPIPPGDLNVALQRSQQNLQNKLSTISRDIALKRADLFVENRKFTIEQVKTLEQILIGYHNSVMERALNAAKAVLDAAIQIFNAQVARYNARLDAYKTEASVFESRVRAALAQFEIFRVVMEGKKLEVDLQRAQVDVYNAQLNGVNAVINIYKVQMEAAQVQANIEQLRIQAFRSLIDAYQAQVQAKVAEFQMFEARIKGEVAKMNAYGEEVRAYTATVEGAKARADILIARLKGQIEAAGHGIEVYKTQAAVYKTDIDAQAQIVDARVRVYGGQVQGAGAQANAIGEALRIDLAENDLEFKRNVENARIAIEKAKISMESLLKSASIRVDAAGHGAGYYRAFVAAAVNSINTLSSLVTQE